VCANPVPSVRNARTSRVSPLPNGIRTNVLAWWEPVRTVQAKRSSWATWPKRLDSSPKLWRSITDEPPPFAE
jgi:hypothetical protein